MGRDDENGFRILRSRVRAGDDNFRKRLTNKTLSVYTPLYSEK